MQLDRTALTKYQTDKISVFMTYNVNSPNKLNLTLKLVKTMWTVNMVSLHLLGLHPQRSIKFQIDHGWIQKFLSGYVCEMGGRGGPDNFC